MKIDRLIGILSILLQQEKVTAPYLADKFEVSRRTINRDIEDLCMAGIPLVTTQGSNGGISIMEGYRLDRTVLTSAEMQSILVGLRSLDSVSGTNKYQQLMDKLSLEESTVLAANSHILIDLSSWHKSRLAPKIGMIQQAIEAGEYIRFQYYAPSGESTRMVEPYCLVFQWTSWYLWGYCQDKQDFRMFKLNRMVGLSPTGKTFEKREVPEYGVVPSKLYPASITIKAVCDSSMRWRLIEEFGPEFIEEAEDGSLVFQCGFTDEQTLFSWLLSMGDRIKLLEPEEARQRFARLTEKIAAIYRV